MARQRRRRNRKAQTSFTRETKTTARAKQGKITKLPPTTTTTPSNYYAFCKEPHWQQRVRLEQGLTIHASAYFDRFQGGQMSRSFTPDLGFYFDDAWARGSMLTTGSIRVPFMRAEPPKVVLPWTDRGIPDDMGQFAKSVDWLLEQLRAGRRVDIGCMGGHGRTGTMLACILVRQGMFPGEAIMRVHDTYCHDAIEGRLQERFVTMYAGFLKGETIEAVDAIEDDKWVTIDPENPLNRWNDSAASIASYLTQADDYWDKRNESTNYHAANQTEEYEEWLRLNTAGLQSLADENRCIDPPCIGPAECVKEKNGCFLATCLRESSSAATDPAIIEGKRGNPRAHYSDDYMVEYDPEDEGFDNGFMLS